MESDEDDKETLNLKHEFKTTRESFQFANDSGNEERAFKKKTLVEDMEDELEKSHDEKQHELTMLLLSFFVLMI